MKQLIVGFDGSDEAIAALRWTAALAARSDAELTAAWVWAGHGVQPHPDYVGALREPARQELEVRCAALTLPVAPDLALVEGETPRALLALADERDADLLVVGPRSAGGPAGVRIGSVTNRLVHRTTRPLAVVPYDAATTPVQRIVLGVDGSAGSLAAIGHCVDLAAALDVPVDAVLALDPLLEWTPSDAWSGWRRAAREQVEEWVAPLRSAGVPVEVTVDRDIHPAAALVRAVGDRPGALVVVGGRRPGPLTHLRRGRIPIQVVHDAPVPVVLVPATEGPGGPS